VPQPRLTLPGASARSDQTAPQRRGKPRVPVSRTGRCCRFRAPAGDVRSVVRSLAAATIGPRHCGNATRRSTGTILAAQHEPATKAIL